MELHERIRLARVSVGVRQKVLAATVGVTANYMCLVEGGRRTPSVGLLRKIAEALSLPVGSLLSGIRTDEDPGAAFDMMASLVGQVEDNKERLAGLLNEVQVLILKVGNMEKERYENT